jgi:hypothetical protein
LFIHNIFIFSLCGDLPSGDSLCSITMLSV